jgi:hypothetical protein
MQLHRFVRPPNASHSVSPNYPHLNPSEAEQKSSRDCQALLLPVFRRVIDEPASILIIDSSLHPTRIADAAAMNQQ